MGLFRIAYGVLVIARLGLFGFVFSGVAELYIDVNLCGIRGCVGFGFLGIGFVLHKRCRMVDWLGKIGKDRGRAEDGRRETEDGSRMNGKADPPRRAFRLADVRL